MLATTRPSTIGFLLTLLTLVPGVAQSQDRTGGVISPASAIQQVKLADDDSELRRLMKERYNESVAQVKDLFELYGRGRVPINDMSYAIESFAASASELAETPVARVSELELALGVAKDVEAITSRKHAVGQEPRIAVQHARICRLGVEIQLVRAREAAKVAREPAR